MSYDLVNSSLEISRKFSRQVWVKALELACSQGWMPLGTAPPYMHRFFETEADWSGTYLTNDGQIVTAEDARALASALERSLDKIPDVAPGIAWDPALWQEDDLPEWLSPEERAIIEETLQDGLLDMLIVDPLDFFAGDEKPCLKQMIRFCRLGSFEIM